VVGSIICGVDGSESAKGAARVARGLSSKLGLGLVFVRVIEDGSPDERVSAIAERLGRGTAAGLDQCDRRESLSAKLRHLRTRVQQSTPG
jgi:nucleotide-binding universal stress UspA family protein